jgi:hypothetical protein
MTKPMMIGSFSKWGPLLENTITSEIQRNVKSNFLPTVEKINKRKKEIK